jgi:hypothetical protein
VAAARARSGLPQPKADLMLHATRLDILDAVATGNAEVARLYFGRQDGVLFDTVVAPATIDQQVTKDEIHAIFTALERHTLVAKPGGSAAKQHVGAALRHRPGVRGTYGYRIFGATVAPLLSARKRKKYREQPKAFFGDGKSLPMRAFRSLISWETGESRDGGADRIAVLSITSARSTLTHRAVVLGARFVLNDRRLRKLKSNPALFYADIQGTRGNFVRGLIAFETRRG